MKFKANKLDAKKLLNGNTEIVLEVEDKKNALISELFDKKQLLSSELAVSIDKWRNKRSLGHNALFWDMCSYLAEHINDPLITAYTIYRELIREYGVSTIYPVDNEILEMVIKDWENRGDGWLTLKLGINSEDEKCTDVKFWFGSSIYDSKKFWRLVEGLKAMCRDEKLDISHYDKQLQLLIQDMEAKEAKLKEKGDKLSGKEKNDRPINMEQ